MKNIFKICGISGFVFSLSVLFSFNAHSARVTSFGVVMNEQPIIDEPVTTAKPSTDKKPLSSLEEGLWVLDYCDGGSNSLSCRYKQSKINMWKIRDRIKYKVTIYACENPTKSDDQKPVLITWYQYYYEGPKPKQTLFCEILDDGMPVGFAHHEPTFCENNKTAGDDSFKEIIKLYEKSEYVCKDFLN